VLSCALAAEPPSEQAPAAQSAAPASAPSAASAATPAAAPATEASNAEPVDEAKKAADQAKRMRGLGWKPKTLNGVTVYCKKEDVIGSRFPTESCASAEIIDMRTQQAKDDLYKYQRQNTVVPRSN